MLSANPPKLTVGLEWHQRLKSHKLFCDCPSELGREPDRTETRYLRLSSSELGEIDQAAILEARRSRRFEYEYSADNACLVELDEAPPHLVNEEALMIALKVALMFNMRVLDELRVMRKVVLDGSNTAGFQRTMLVAIGTDSSKVHTSAGDVRITTLCLEEESAFIVTTGQKEAVYRLDRLGIPLIEIATAPDIHTPEQAREIAEEVGLMLRLTGNMQRGIGSIRQDLNVSVEGGSRQEIKGVQELQQLSKMVELEGARQSNLLKIRDELRRRGVVLDQPKCFDVTALLADSHSSLVRNAIKKGQKALCLRASGFEGLLGLEVAPGRRFGTELTDRARTWAGVGGTIHSDELPAYGITEAECASIREACGIKPSAAFIMVLAEEPRATRALQAVHDRLREALSGVPSETRRANGNGTTSYLRPLPGSARMYPETDLPPIVIKETTLEQARKALPPTPSELKDRMVGLGLSEQVASQLIRSPKLEILQAAVSQGAAPAVAATAILTILPNLRRENVDVESIEESELAKGLAGFCRLDLPKESMEQFLRELATKRDADLALSALKAPRLTKEEARIIIKQIVAERIDFVREKGRDSIKPLMGPAMEKLKGRLSGTDVHKILEEEVEAVL